MDNLSSHNGPAIGVTIEAQGVNVLYLPPYPAGSDAT
jgi:hypothetical protein